MAQRKRRTTAAKRVRLAGTAHTEHYGEGTPGVMAAGPKNEAGQISGQPAQVRKSKRRTQRRRNPE